MKKLEMIRSILSILLLIVPMLSILISTLYYYFLFVGMKPLSTEVLTISDHVNRASDALAPVFLTASAMLIYFSRFRDKTIKKTINDLQDALNTKSILTELTKVRVKVVILALALLFLIPDFFAPTYMLFLKTPLYLTLYFLFIFKDGDSGKLLGVKISLAVALQVFIFLSAAKAFNVRQEIFTNSQSDEIVHLDFISNGTITGKNGRIYFESESQKNHSNKKVGTFWHETLLCHLDFDKFCLK